MKDQLHVTVVQVCGVGAGTVKRRRVLGRVGVGVLTTLAVRFLSPTPDVELNHF